ncbi:MAG: hypothetical protein K5837_01350 [Candidatus Saccharibacteria bacterium]|nr:hypothetical protein [Candidatus Saccharibacteria bacterium]
MRAILRRKENGHSQTLPSKGKIIVEDDGLFSGYCDELYGSISSDKTRYLFGHLAQDEHGKVTGIAFFKLSNDRNQAPLIYLVAGLKTSRVALWGSLSLSFGTLVSYMWHGEATINTEEDSDSDEVRASITKRLNEFERKVVSVKSPA